MPGTLETALEAFNRKALPGCSQCIGRTTAAHAAGKFIPGKHRNRHPVRNPARCVVGDGLSHRLAVRRVAPPPGHPRIFGPNPTISSADAEPEYAIQGSQQDFDFLIVFD
ncbi:MAG: hypothetical protein EOR67_19325 [Mesorhizobium sp.]|uniref:hypothetical protein n=1 Tax=Mesorhizobium sp. TaxID=1871066 RepID=UPI000FE4ECFE|nr:hypothetical protein [Mesorhizobium sp.]RWL80578.1 MAG: hypothetical protein EOR69_21540 [Mesorhizobium sp.]RWL86026.1 MAG: hypothetical protein EOR67_19325 [Mesorhizobium sp.]RWL97472.1 MAG: hypothetical protein EOR70_15830 [Mesorhizobium sp.]